MCKRCYSRSATVLAALVAGAPVETERPDEGHGDTAPWDGKVVDAFKGMTAALGERVASSDDFESDEANRPFDTRVDEILAGLTSTEVLSLAGLAEAIGRHGKSFSRLASTEFADRVEKGEPEATQALANQTNSLMESMLGKGGTQALGTMLSDLIKAAESARPADPNLN